MAIGFHHHRMAFEWHSKGIDHFKKGDNHMQITSIEPITWKFSEPSPGAFPCYACHGVNGNATHFVNAEKKNGEDYHKLKFPVCGKCAEYARAYPTWLEEMLFQRRMETAATYMTTATEAR